MKKLLSKITRSDNTPPETGGRITNETVAEHRERVLAGGRKFKYPMQYTKHRVLIMSLVIVVVTTISLFGFCFWQLYTLQNTDQFFYRLTQFAPLPVAKVDGEWVRYSDYLMELRSAIHYLTTKEAVNFNSDDGRRQLDFQKRLALDKGIENTLVAKLARENQIAVATKEVNDFVEKQISSNRLGVTEDLYRQVIREYYDWTFEEYKNTVRQQLLAKKVNAKLDTEARNKIQEISNKLGAGADFMTLAKEQSEDLATKAQGGDVGIVAKSAEDPNGLIAEAVKLQPGQLSGIIEGTNGFYVIKLLEAREADVHFAKIFISYKLLEQKLTDLRQNNKVQEFISVKEVARPTNQ